MNQWDSEYCINIGSCLYRGSTRQQSSFHDIGNISYNVYIMSNLNIPGILVFEPEDAVMFIIGA